MKLFQAFTMLILLLEAVFAFGNNDLKMMKKRELATTSKYTPLYSKPFDMDNNLTGTGNRLKDSVYNAICSTLKCNTLCCEGHINQMTCGKEENCVKYQEYLEMVKIITATVIPWGIALVISIMGFCWSKGSNKWQNFWLCIIGFLLLPITIFVLIYYGCATKCCNCKKEKNHSHKTQDAPYNTGRDNNYVNNPAVNNNVPIDNQNNINMYQQNAKIDQNNVAYCGVNINLPYEHNQSNYPVNQYDQVAVQNMGAPSVN